jgi:hypothetical protein
MFQIAIRNPSGQVGWHAFINEKGNRYGRWFVTDFAGVAKERAFWWCLCNCGNIGKVAGTALRAGVSKSCGCTTAELARERLTKYRHEQTGRMTIHKKKEGDTQ